MKNKKAVLNTIESLMAGLFIFMLIIAYLNYTGQRIRNEQIDISELIYDTNFRSAIISNNITKADNICNFYYNPLSFNCSVAISDLSFNFNQTGDSNAVYNIMITGNETLYQPKIARIILTQE